VIATAFFLHSEKSMSIYGADLLGAGAGSLSVLAILGSSGPEYAVVIASTLCLAGYRCQADGSRPGVVTHS